MIYFDDSMELESDLNPSCSEVDAIDAGRGPTEPQPWEGVRPKLTMVDFNAPDDVAPTVY